MNIFFLDENVEKCAQYHCDKHCVKMILETAQLLCSAHWMVGNEAPYRLTHKNHPCAIWVRKSIYNYNWLLELGFALCAEYHRRYDKVHKCQAVMDWCEFNIPDLPEVPFSVPPQCMPDIYKQSNTVKAYRAYYMGEKAGFAVWKHTLTPTWFRVD